MLSGKNKQRFEEWYNVNLIDKCNSLVLVNVKSFYNLPLEMQKGVYEKYFDSLGYDIIVDKTPRTKGAKGSWYVTIYDVDNHILYDKTLEVETRLEAFEEAVKQLDKLINEELTKQDK